MDIFTNLGTCKVEKSFLWFSTPGWYLTGFVPQ